MKMRKNLVVIGTVLASSFGIVADGYAACQDWGCQDVTIERLYVRSDGEISVSTTGLETNLDCLPDETAPSERIYLTLQRSHVSQKEIYAVLLSAKLVNHEIWIRLRSGQGVPCTINYVVLE